jgi:diaminopimelate epimerase
VPHVVIEIPAFESFENWKERCREIRNSPDFSPKGTNVTLILRQADLNTVKAVSFERGVEDFTLACGTGAVAAALYMNQKYKNTKTSVEMPGGTLNIDMSDLKKPIMVGPAKHLEDYMYEFST